MQKASGILVTKNDDYGYIDRFIGFLDRIINIIISAFERLSALGSKATTTASDATAATPTD